MDKLLINSLLKLKLQKKTSVINSLMSKIQKKIFYKSFIKFSRVKKSKLNFDKNSRACQK